MIAELEKVNSIEHGLMEKIYGVVITMNSVRTMVGNDPPHVSLQCIECLWRFVNHAQKPRLRCHVSSEGRIHLLVHLLASNAESFEHDSSHVGIGRQHLRGDSLLGPLR